MNPRPECDSVSVFDPIVKFGTEKLTADDILSWIDAHPGSFVATTGIHGKWEALERAERRRAHRGKGSVFEARAPRADPKRTDVRL